MAMYMLNSFVFKDVLHIFPAKSFIRLLFQYSLRDITVIWKKNHVNERYQEYLHILNNNNPAKLLINL